MKLDFNIIQTKNSKTITFIDESNYGDTNPIFPTLQVKFPDLEKTYKCLIKPQKINALYTQTLGFTNSSVDFPDGIYDLRYSIEPHNKYYVCKKYLKVDNAYNKLRDLSSSLTCKDEKFFDELAKINLLLLSSQDIVNTNTNLAIEQYKIALKLINNYNCK